MCLLYRLFNEGKPGLQNIFYIQWANCPMMQAGHLVRGLKFFSTLWTSNFCFVEDIGLRYWVQIHLCENAKYFSANVYYNLFNEKKSFSFLKKHSRTTVFTTPNEKCLSSKHGNRLRWSLCCIIKLATLVGSSERSLRSRRYQHRMRN